MRIKTVFLKMAVLVLLASMFFVPPTSRLVAARNNARAEPSTEHLSFGMVGIAHGQTLRLNVVAMSQKGDKSTVDNPVDVPVPPGPCRVELSLLDDAGNALMPAVQRALELGHATFVDLNRDFLDRVGNRVEVRAAVTATCPEPGTQFVIATLEVFDNSTGKTGVVLNTWAGNNASN